MKKRISIPKFNSKAPTTKARYELVPLDECPTAEDQYHCQGRWLPCAALFAEFGTVDISAGVIIENTSVNGHAISAFRRLKNIGTPQVEAKTDIKEYVEWVRGVDIGSSQVGIGYLDGVLSKIKVGGLVAEQEIKPLDIKESVQYMRRLLVAESEISGSSTSDDAALDKWFGAIESAMA